jgi:hypothetical protein
MTALEIILSFVVAVLAIIILRRGDRISQLKVKVNLLRDIKVRSDAVQSWFDGKGFDAAVAAEWILFRGDHAHKDIAGFLVELEHDRKVKGRADQLSRLNVDQYVSEILERAYHCDSRAESMDQAVVDAAGVVMSNRLDVARNDGRDGWYSELSCSMETLYSLLSSALEDNDLSSVINYAAMIYARSVMSKYSIQ